VVIVVAAATAFSFFVASYQKQVQAQETLSHDRALEDVKVIEVSEVLCSATLGNCNSGATPGSFASISLLVSSLDVNRIGIAGLILDDNAVVSYNATFANGTTVDPCYNASAHVSGDPTSGLIPCAPLGIPSYSAVKLVFNLNENGANPNAGPYAFGGSFAQLLPTSDITFELLTLLTNVFTASFSPPDAVASVFFVSSGSSTVPVFDGLNSYQPVGGNNASIVWYNWTTIPITTGAPVCPPYSGAEFECAYLTSGDSYTITLQVTNTDGLSGSTSFEFTEP